MTILAPSSAAISLFPVVAVLSALLNQPLATHVTAMLPITGHLKSLFVSIGVDDVYYAIEVGDLLYEAVADVPFSTGKRVSTRH